MESESVNKSSKVFVVTEAKQNRAEQRSCGVRRILGFAFCLVYGKDVNKCIYIQMTVIWLAGI